MYDSLGGPLYYDDGRRIEVFPFWANFRKDYIERWEWRTSVLTTYSGKEQRIMLRKHPRRYLEFEVFARDTDRQALDNFLWSGPSKLFAAPDWVRGVKVQADHYNSSTIAVTGHFLPDSYVIGYYSPDHYELRKVVSTSATDITLDVPCSWPKGMTVFPAVLCTSNDQNTTTRLTGRFAYAIASLNGLAVPSWYDSVSPSTYPSYQGMPVIEEFVDWSSGRQSSYVYKSQLVDVDTTAPFMEIESPVTLQNSEAAWVLNSTDNIDRFLSFIHGCKGKLRPLLNPTGSADLIPVNVIGNDLVAAYTGFSKFVYPGSRPYLRVQLKNGNIIYCAVTLVTDPYDGTEVFTLDTALGVIASDIYMVSFMDVARFDTDRVELAYKGPTFAVSKNVVRTLNVV